MSCSEGKGRHPAVTATKMTTEACRPMCAPLTAVAVITLVRAKSLIDCGTSRTTSVPTKNSKKPRNRLSVPSVTMSDGARSLVTSSPLIRPRKTPMRAETAQRRMKGAPGKKATASFTVQYMAVTPTAAKETSSPPVTRTRKKPIANRPITVLFFSKENMLKIEKKTGLMVPTVSARTTSTRKISTSWRRTTCRNFMTRFRSRSA